MAKFSDLDEYFSPGLTLTVLGNEYTLPLPSAELGLWCRRIAQTAGEVGAASTDEELQAAGERAHARATALPELPGDLTFEERLLGSAHAEMVADKVSDPHIEFCARTAFIWVVSGEEAAERYWKAGGRPEAMARGNRAERRANARKTSTGGASETKPPGSTSGTSTPKRSNGSGRARRSRGRRS